MVVNKAEQKISNFKRLEPFVHNFYKTYYIFVFQKWIWMEQYEKRRNDLLESLPKCILLYKLYSCIITSVGYYYTCRNTLVT